MNAFDVLLSASNNICDAKVFYEQPKSENKSLFVVYTYFTGFICNGVFSCGLEASKIEGTVA